MRLILIRHGQSLGNVEGRIQGEDDPLTDIGRDQARALAKAIAARSSVTHLYASPLARAFETASIVGTAINLEPVPLPGLAEINAGTAIGLRWADWVAQNPELGEIMARANRELHYGWEGGEDGHQFSGRVFAAYDELVTRHLGTQDVVAAVTHGGPLSWISARLHADPLTVWPTARGNFLNCSITEVDIDGDGVADVLLLNETAHLDGVLLD